MNRNNQSYILEIESPVAKQALHLRNENPTPSLKPPRKLLAGVSPQTQTTAP